jgi:hypothetical protein
MDVVVRVVDKVRRVSVGSIPGLVVVLGNITAVLGIDNLFSQ